ncbi:MAG: glycosyltransferase [Bdellovibrionota bacterium]
MNKDKSLVTVIMSVYNENSKFLNAAISSILNQTYNNLEFIIINDGSTEELTIKTIADWENKDSRVRVLSQPNRGLTKSLNIALQNANGNFICRQDSDDWSDLTRIDKQIHFLRSNLEIGLVGSQALLHQENGTALWDTKLPTDPTEITKYLEQNGNPFIHGSVCFRKDLSINIGMYREELKFGQDYDFFYRLCEITKGANLQKSLYNYRYTASAAPKSASYHNTTSLTQILAKLRKETGADSYDDALGILTESRPESPSNLPQLSFADRLMLAGSYRQSAVQYIRAILNSPFDRISWLKFCRFLIFLLFPVFRAKLYRNKF